MEYNLIGKMLMEERNVKIYNAALEYLRSIKPQGVKLETYFIEKKRNYESLTDVYVRFIGSAQNYQAMPNIIGFYKRKEEFSSMLFDFDYVKIAELHEVDLYRSFRDSFHVTSKDTNRNCWFKWSRAVIDSAKFVSGFRDAEDFDTFVKRFDYNATSRMALPLLIQAKIRGIGFALACDALKELGYTDYSKPDVHLIDVFKEAGICEGNPVSVYEAISRMADDCNETPYKVDKVFWLI